MKRWQAEVKLYQTKQKKRRRRVAFFLLSMFASFVVLVFVYIYAVVNPIVIEATSQAVYSLSTSAVSDAVYDVLADENLSYDDLVSVEYDTNGDVALISLNSVMLNLIARKFYQVAQVYLDEMGDVGVDVSLGTFTGLSFLSGIGPKVNLKLTPIGAMTSAYESEFESAGINQTKHSLYIHLYASVSLILPCYSATIDSETQVLVAESVIVGKVPEVYLGGSLLST